MFSFEIKDAIDIFLVAIMLYYTYRFMRESRSINVFIGILVFILVWLLVSRVVEMRLLGAILDKLVGVGSLAILILFQDEIRKFLNNLGGHNRIRTLLKFFSSNEQKKEDVDRVNQRLIENIFFKNSPLHDGAMIISNHRIKAAGCILPVSHDLNIPRELGLRHRAAMGMSQASDALCIVVSEETGRISAAINGQFRLRLSAENLESLLNEELSK